MREIVPALAAGASLGFAAPAGAAVAVNLLEDTRFQTGGVCGLDFQVETSLEIARIRMSYRVEVPDAAPIACTMQSAPLALAEVSCDSARTVDEPCAPGFAVRVGQPVCEGRDGAQTDCGEILLTAPEGIDFSFE